MTTSELNKRYGAPGRIVFRDCPTTDAPIVALANQYGSCEISLYGGRILSYKPTGHAQVLFLPKDPGLTTGDKGMRHGGIPICWPWFGTNGEPGTWGHGFARFSTFSVRASEYSEDESAITLALKSSPETKAMWPYDFDLELKISVSMKLNILLKTTNTDTKPFKITEGFHPYFLVSERDRCVVRGVDGCNFCDARVSTVDDRLWAGDLAVNEPFDHVFTLTKHEHVLLDNGLNRAIALVSRGNSKLVVWNPGPEDKIHGNLGADDWKKFVCVEPATLFRDAAFEVKPGESHSLLAAIQSTVKP